MSRGESDSTTPPVSVCALNLPLICTPASKDLCLGWRPRAKDQQAWLRVIHYVRDCYRTGVSSSPPRTPSRGWVGARTWPGSQLRERITAKSAGPGLPRNLKTLHTPRLSARLLAQRTHQDRRGALDSTVCPTGGRGRGPTCGRLPDATGTAPSTPWRRVTSYGSSLEATRASPPEEDGLTTTLGSAWPVCSRPLCPLPSCRRPGSENPRDPPSQSSGPESRSQSS